MPIYRVANNQFCIQQVAYGTGACPNTAGAVQSTGFFEPPQPDAARAAPIVLDPRQGKEDEVPIRRTDGSHVPLVEQLLRDFFEQDEGKAPEEYVLSSEKILRWLELQGETESTAAIDPTEASPLVYCRMILDRALSQVRVPHLLPRGASAIALGPIIYATANDLLTRYPETTAYEMRGGFMSGKDEFGDEDGGESIANAWAARFNAVVPGICTVQYSADEGMWTCIAPFGPWVDCLRQMVGL